MATRPIDFIISAINQASPVVNAVVRDFRALQSEARAANEALGKAIEPNAFQRAAAGISSIGAAYFGIQQAIGVATAAGGKFYDLLIGQNERLTQQLLQSAATIASTSRVFQDGLQVQDSGRAIIALQQPLLSAIKEVEEATLDLVGVTSQQTSGVFNLLLSNAAQLTNQSTQFKDAIGAATALAPSLVATLGSLGLPLQQASQEIRSILTGTIDQNSVVAKLLGLNNELVAKYQSQGVLVDQLIAKFQPFIEANKLAARSVAGLTSNIQDVIELTAREAGKPLQELLVDTLAGIYGAISANRGQIEAVVVPIFASIADLGKEAIAGFSAVLGALQPSLIATGAALGEVFNAGIANGQTAIQNFAAAAVALIQALTPAIQLLSALTIAIADFAQTPLGSTLVQVGLALTTVNAALPIVIAGIATLGAGALTASQSIASLLVALNSTNIAQTLFIARQAIQAVATGTTTAAIQAQAIAQAQLTLGNSAAAASALQVATAEQAKAAALRQGAIAIAGNVAKLGLLSAAVASVAAAIQSFQELTKYTREAEESIAEINEALLEAEAASAKISGNAAAQFQSIGEAAKFNAAAIKENLGGIQGFFQYLIDESPLRAVATLFRALFPSLRPQIDAALGELDRLRQGLGISTPLEAAERDADQSFGKISNSAAETARRIKDLLNGAFSADSQNALNTQLANAQKQLVSIETQIADAKSKGSIDRVDALTREKTAIESTISTLQDQRRQFNASREDALRAIDAQIKALKQQRPADPADVQTQRDQIRLFEELQTKIKETNELEIKPLVPENRGSVLEQLKKEIDSVNRALATATTTDEVDKAAKRITEATQQQFQLGAIAADQAARQLESVRADGRASYQTQLAAQKAITGVYQSEGERRLGVLKAEQAEIQALIEQGAIGAAEGARRASENQLAQLQAQLEQTQAAIARAGDSGQGNSDESRKLLATEQRLQAEIASTKAKERERVNAEELKDFDEQQSILEGKRAQGLVSEQQFSQESLDIALARSDKELQQVQQARSRINAADTEGLEALAAKEAEIYGRRQQALQEFEQRQLDAISRRQKEAEDAVNLSSINRETALQQLVNAGVLRTAQAEEQKVQIQRQGIEAQLRVAQQGLAELEALPSFSDPTLERDRQSQIRQARIETANLTKSLVQNEYEQQQASFNALKDQLDRQSQAAQNAANVDAAPLETALKLNDEINKSLESRSALLASQKGLAEAIASATQSDIKILSEGARTAKQRQDLERAGAAIRLQNLRIQQQYELEALQIQQRQNELALERQQIELQIQKIRAQADAATARSELKKAEADPTATPEQVDAARFRVQAADETIGLLSVAEQGLQESAENSRRAFANQQRSTQIQQAAQERAARLELAQTLPAGQRRRATRQITEEITGQDRGGFNSDLRAFIRSAVSREFGGVNAPPARSPLALPSAPRLPAERQIQRPQIDQSKPPATFEQNQTQPLQQIFGAVRSIAERLSRLDGLVNLNQENSIVNQFNGSDVGNGNFASTIEQQVLNSLFLVGQQLLGDA